MRAQVRPTPAYSTSLSILPQLLSRAQVIKANRRAQIRSHSQTLRPVQNHRKHTSRMGIDNYSYINSMQGQHSPEYYHYSPPSIHEYHVPIKQEVHGVPDHLSEHSGDSASQMSSPAYEPQNSDKSISDVLKSTYGTWDRVRDQLWIPRDPRDWTREHVSHWLSWAIREFSLGSGSHIDSFISSLSMSGKELCGMSKQDFITRAPLFMGDILWAHLEILQRETDQTPDVKTPPSLTVNPSSYYLPQHPLPPSSISKTYTELEPPVIVPPPLVSHHTISSTSSPVTPVTAPVTYSSYAPPPPPYYSSYTPPYPGHNLNWMSTNDYLQCLPPSSFTLPPNSIPTQPSPPPSLTESQSPGGPCFTGSGPIQLWQFLLELLTDKSCLNIISWTGDGWEFKMNDPDEVAIRWGLRKNKPKMNYEKMSRAMRYYYDKNIILKTPGKRYVYRFICDLQGLLGFSSTEIQAMVSGTAPTLPEVVAKC